MMGFVGGSEGFDYTAIIGKIYFILPLAIKSYSSWVDLLIFVAVNFLPFLAVMLVVAVTYKFMNTVIKSRKKTKNYKLKTYAGGTQRKALLVKEIKRLFSDANYVINCIMGPIISVIGTIAMCIIFRSIGYVEGLLFIFPIIFSFAHMIAPPTSCSLSLEGNAFWIIKTAPVSIKSLLSCKLMVNVIFNAAPALVSGLVGMIIMGAPWYVCILMATVAVSIALLAGAIGLMFNLLFPKMKWESTTAAIKQSTSVALSLGCAFVYMAVCFLIGYFIPLSPVINLIIVLALTVVLNVILHILVYKNGERLIMEKT